MMMLFFLLLSAFLSPPCNHTALSLSLFLSAVASQDQAITADRRRVGSINRNWTNYEADVPMYEGGGTVSERVEVALSVVLSLSL